MDVIRTSKEGHQFRMEPVCCPTCGPVGEEAVGTRGGRFHRYNLGIETPIVRCLQCGLLYPNPFPHPLDGQALYADPAKYFESHDTEARVEAFRVVARGIRDRVEGPPSLLDVGAGRGEMVRAALAEGIEDVVALEPSDAVRDEAVLVHGVELVPRTIEAYADAAGREFTAITLNAVLEHVPDPASMIAACRRLLRPDGVLYLDIPNEENLVARVVGALNWARGSSAIIALAPTFPPFHVWGFSPPSIRALLARHGFRIEELKVEAHFRVPARGSLADQLKARAIQSLQPIANATGTAHNMFIWARRGG